MLLPAVLFDECAGKLTALYYANPSWTQGDGGELRVFEGTAGAVTGEQAKTPEKRAPVDSLNDAPPYAKHTLGVRGFASP